MGLVFLMIKILDLDATEFVAVLLILVSLLSVIIQLESY